MNWINWSIWLPYITIAFVILTVFVGLIGLRQGHYSKGKLTRRGRRAVALIIALGAVTLASSIADQQISASKEEAERQVRDTQFMAQMQSLRTATRDLTVLRAGMERSLHEQIQLYDAANRNIELTAALQRETQASTLRVLQRLFQESNRITADRVGLSVAFGCQYPDEDSDRPELTNVHIMIEDRSGEARILSSGQKLQNGIISVFDGFSGDLGMLESIEAWRDATISILLFADASRVDGHRLADMQRNEEARRQRGGSDPGLAECTAEARLLLNGREVLSSSGRIMHIAAGRYSGMMSPLQVEASRLPRFVR